MNVKRYEFTPCSYLSDCEPVLHPDGEWVLWEDVVPFIKQTEDVVKSNAKLIRERDALQKAVFGIERCKTFWDGRKILITYYADLEENEK
jgi:hypothetical protein